MLLACKVLGETLPAKDAVVQIRKELRAHFDNEAAYIQNTHLITTKDRGVVPLRWNKAQRGLYDVIQHQRKEGLPIRVIITKSRQQGCSTFVQSWQYEQIDINPFRKALTINFDDDNSSELFQKAKMIHDTNYCPRPTVRDSSHIIHFANPHGSIFQVQTAGKIEVARSLTVHHAHASEMPLWPDADTTFTAVNNAVPTTPNTSVIKESTARGAFGHHYEEWNRAERGESDYIPYFSPWYWQDEYRLPFPSKEAESLFKQKCSKKDHDYRDRYGLGWDQMHWRAWKMRSDLKDSAAIFDQEYPASASVAFLTTGLSVFDAAKVMAIEHECTPPYWIGDILLVSPSHSQQSRQP